MILYDTLCRTNVVQSRTLTAFERSIIYCFLKNKKLKNIFAIPIDTIHLWVYNTVRDQERGAVRMTVNELRDMADKYSDRYQYVGVRTQEEPFELGEIDHVSSVWDDGDETDEKLNGVSTTNIHSSALRMHTDCDPRYGFYFGDHKAIIAGDFAEYGEDPGEIIISDPVVVEIIA